MDAKQVHTIFLQGKETYTINTQEVDPKTKLKIKLAPEGGNAIHLKKI